MALVTETTLREQFKDGNFPKCYVVPAGVIVTPSARAWLVDHRIDLTIGDAPRIQPAVASPASTSALPAFTKPDHFDVIDGSEIVEKPEHLTALRGNLLVPKDHPQIRFRGQIDALEADILVAQVAFQRLGLPTGVADLGEVLRYVKQILRCEVLDLPFDGGKLFGMDEGKLRQLSHHPQETFGIPHFAASVEDGEAVVLLNQLRTKVRQVELAAYDAFSAGGVGPPSRVDLIQALNRLSSAIYIMMFKAKVERPVKYSCTGCGALDGQSAAPISCDVTTSTCTRYGVADHPAQHVLARHSNTPPTS